ncbi:MAG: hypothetical protein H6Q61_272 [Firmicutes bacterium]|nr:hypothetical protein [Bacillota bacterium]
MEFSNQSIFSLPALEAMLWFSDHTIQPKIKKFRRGLAAVSGIVCLILAFYLRQNPYSNEMITALLPAIGGVLLVMTFAYPVYLKYLAKQQMKGQNYAYHFQFKEDAFTAGFHEKATAYSYSSLYALRENADYFALFLAPRQAYMVDKLGFQNVADAEAFGPFLEEKTGLTIQRF